MAQMLVKFTSQSELHRFDSDLTLIWCKPDSSSFAGASKKNRHFHFYFCSYFMQYDYQTVHCANNIRLIDCGKFYIPYNKVLATWDAHVKGYGIGCSWLRLFKPTFPSLEVGETENFIISVTSEFWCMHSQAFTLMVILNGYSTIMVSVFSNFT